MGSYIKFGKDSGGWRDFLDGKPIHCGDQLQILTLHGWAWVRYEMGNYETHEALLFTKDDIWQLNRNEMLFRRSPLENQ